RPDLGRRHPPSRRSQPPAAIARRGRRAEARRHRTRLDCGRRRLPVVHGRILGVRARTGNGKRSGGSGDAQRVAGDHAAAAGGAGLAAGWSWRATWRDPLLGLLRRSSTPAVAGPAGSPAPKTGLQPSETVLAPKDPKEKDRGSGAEPDKELSGMDRGEHVELKK